jgi:uncharacterized protein YggE
VSRRGRLGAALLIVASLMAGCAGALESTEARRAIAVTGTGSVSMRPDLAVVTLGAEARRPGLADAVADVSQRMTAVLARLRALGIAERDVRTVTYAIEPRATSPRPDEAPPRITAYHVANVVQVKSRRLDGVAALVEAAVTAGANTVRGIAFTVEDPAAAQAEARTLAVRDAAARARRIADAAGVTLGEVLSITEGGAVRPLPPRMTTMAMEAAGPVEPGQLEIVVTVETRYAIGR